MQIFVPILALLSSVVIALPTDGVSLAGDGRGATIFTEPELHEISTFIPGNAYCTDLNNILGNFDGKIRGMIVEKGMRCRFHVTYGCPVSGLNFEFGSKDQALAVGSLPEWLDKKIHSVYCAQL